MTSNATITETAATVTYASAVKRGQTAVKNMETASWTLGDLALTVEPKHGKKTHQQLAEDISAAGRPLPYKTLLNFRTVAGAYAAGERTDNHFTVHAAFASQDDRVALVASKIWTVSEARKLVSERKAAAKLAESGGNGVSEGDASGATVSAETDELAVAIANRDRLAGEFAAAEARVKAIEAKRGIVAAPAGPIVHSPAGIPSHTVAEPHAACPDCKTSGVTPIISAPDAPPAAGRKTRHARKPAAAAKAA
jgi:hypothetical protein